MFIKVFNENDKSTIINTNDIKVAHVEVIKYSPKYNGMGITIVLSTENGEFSTGEVATEMPEFISRELEESTISDMYNCALVEILNNLHKCDTVPSCSLEFFVSEWVHKNGKRIFSTLGYL